MTLNLLNDLKMTLSENHVITNQCSRALGFRWSALLRINQCFDSLVMSQSRGILSIRFNQDQGEDIKNYFITQFSARCGLVSI